MNDSFYNSKNKIYTKGRIDLAIYEDENTFVIFECKKPKISEEIISESNLNTKVFHELILYYLSKRIEFNNTNIKHLVATNMYEWFVFDERDFDRVFYRNAKLVKDYETYRNERKDTNHFYKSIAKVFWEKEKNEFSYVHFDVRDYKKSLQTIDLTDENQNKTTLITFPLISHHYLLIETFISEYLTKLLFLEEHFK